MNKTIKRTLEETGLSKEEIAVYLAGLELGERPVQDIARKAGTKRPTTYKILESLMSKGLFYQTFRGKKRFFGAQDPKELEIDFKRKASELERIMPELYSIYNTPGIKPKVKFYEGISGAISIYEDTIVSSPQGGEILSYTGIRNLNDIFPKQYPEKYIKKRVEKSIRARIIAVDSKESREWHQRAKQELRDILLVPEERFDFSGDTEIYGDKVALISYRENFMAVVIESREIARMQKFIFNLAWKNLSVAL